MASPEPAKFLSSTNGLMTSSIFDRGSEDMDDSEEMEEIRELLYEMIKKNFPMGVSATHLAQKYYEEYVEKGIGRALPQDWLQQVTAAEEFEAQTRGPITILFIRLQNTSSFKRPPINHVNVRIISSGAQPTEEELREHKKRKETEPLEHAKTLSKTSSNLVAGCEVLVVALDSCQNLHIRSKTDDISFNKISSNLDEVYAHELKSPLDSRIAIYEVVKGGAYALKDSNGNWFRVVTLDRPHSGLVECVFIDVGVSDKYPVNALRLLPAKDHPVMSINAMAKKVSLGIAETGGHFQKGNLTNQLTSLVFNRVGDPKGPTFAPKILTLESIEEKHGVTGVELIGEDGLSINELLLGSVASAQRVNLSKSPTPPKQPSVSTPSPFSALSCSFDENFVIEPLDASKMPTAKFPANALFAAGPNDISLRQLSLDPMPDYMYSKLKDECELEEAKLKDEPTQKGFYAAFIDTRWERVQLLQQSKIDKLAYCVYLVDVGAFHYVRKEMLRKLNSKSPFRKILMFKCKLSDVIPIEGQGVWSREAHEAVREFFEAACGQTVTVEPSSSEGWSTWKQANTPAVPQCSARINCCGKDLGEWLVACGLAMRV